MHGQLQTDLDNIQNWCQIWLNLYTEIQNMHLGTPSTTSEYMLYDISTGQCVLLAEADYI